MRVLVLPEMGDLDIGLLPSCVARDQAAFDQFRGELGWIDSIERQDADFQPLEIAFEAPFPVGLRPQPDKKEPGERRQPADFRVVEELRLDSADSSHHSASLRFSGSA
jgi:hypothetical protein